MPALSMTEGASFVYSATLQSEDSTGVSVDQLTSLTLTHYDVETGVIINARSSQNVLSTNNVAITTTGGLTWEGQPEDAVVINKSLPAGAIETHRALFKVVFGTTAKTCYHEATFYVTQRTKV